MKKISASLPKQIHDADMLKKYNFEETLKIVLVKNKAKFDEQIDIWNNAEIDMK